MRGVVARCVTGSILGIAAAGCGASTAIPVAAPESAIATTAAPAEKTALPMPATAGSSPATAATEPLAGQSAPDAKSAAAVLAARNAVAEQNGVPLDDVTLVAVESVVWPDSSLGCPRPGQSYMQVLTPGFRVQVAVEGATVTVHTDMSIPPALAQCGAPAGPGGASPYR